MAHYSRILKVVIDVPPAEHDAELAFWQGASGEPLDRFEQHPEYHGSVLHGQEFRLLVQRLEDGAPRVHLDIHTDDRVAEVERLERLGAKLVGQLHHWSVMQDPAGLPFCVIEGAPEPLHDGNAHRWE